MPRNSPPRWVWVWGHQPNPTESNRSENWWKLWFFSVSRILLTCRLLGLPFFFCNVETEVCVEFGHNDPNSCQFHIFSLFSPTCAWCHDRGWNWPFAQRGQTVWSYVDCEMHRRLSNCSCFQFVPKTARGYSTTYLGQTSRGQENSRNYCKFWQLFFCVSDKDELLSCHFIMEDHQALQADSLRVPYLHATLLRRPLSFREKFMEKAERATENLRQYW